MVAQDSNPLAFPARDAQRVAELTRRTGASLRQLEGGETVAAERAAPAVAEGAMAAQLVPEDQEEP